MNNHTSEHSNSSSVQHRDAGNILRELLNNPPNNQSVNANLGVEIIDVDAISDNGYEHDIPVSQNNNHNAENHVDVVLVTATTAGVRNEAQPSQPIVQNSEFNVRETETPDSRDWSIASPLLADREEFEADTVSSIVSLSDIMRARNTRENRLDRRESEVRRREAVLRQRELDMENRENRGTEKSLKKKIDEWLAKPRGSRNPNIDQEIVGFAMTQHPYLWMSTEDRRRINSTRCELDAMQDIARRNADKEMCCPICFDSFKTPRPFMVLECGHINCYDCIQQMDRVAGREANARCSECFIDIRMDHLRRVYFASRD